MTIYDRFYEEITIIDARLVPTRANNGEMFPGLYVDVQYADGSRTYNMPAIYLKADKGSDELMSVIHQLKGDLWAQYYRHNPIVRVFVWGNRRDKVVRVVITRVDGKETDRELHDTPASRRYVRRMMAALKSAYVCEVEWPEDKYNVPFGHFNLIFTPKEKRT